MKKICILICMLYVVVFINATEKKTRGSHFFGGAFGQGADFVFSADGFEKGFFSFKGDFYYTYSNVINKYCSMGLTLSGGNSIHLDVFLVAPLFIYVMPSVIQYALVNSLSQRVLFHVKTGNNVREKYWVFESGVSFSLMGILVRYYDLFEKQGYDDTIGVVYMFGPYLFIGGETLKTVIHYNRKERAVIRKKVSLVFGTFFSWNCGSLPYSKENPISSMFSAGVEFRVGGLKK